VENGIRNRHIRRATACKTRFSATCSERPSSWCTRTKWIGVPKICPCWNGTAPWGHGAPDTKPLCG